MESMRRLVCLGLLLASLAVHAAPSGAPLKIGLSYPRTGNDKAEGLEQMRGALLAVDQINAAGGVLGRPLQLETANSASRAENAVRNVDRLHARGVAMIFGGATSEEVVAASQRAREQGLLYFATLAYANEVTGQHGHRYLFRESGSARMSARVLGEYLAIHQPRRRYFHITRDDAWGRSMESALRESTSSQDKARHGRRSLAASGARLADMRAALEAAAKSESDVLVLNLLGNDLVQIMSLVDQQGLNRRLQLIVPHLTKPLVEQIGPTIMAGVIGSETWTWKSPQLENSAAGQDFVRDFIAANQEYPGSTAASTYTIVRQWADAVSRAGSSDSEAVIRALEGHRYQLLKGPQEWRAFDHQNVQDVYAVRVRPREEIMRDPLKQDYFEIIHRLRGDQAAVALEDWEQERDSLTLE
jgi:ABC-type branched-subunit amino acid transport system substrate-binding protein